METGWEADTTGSRCVVTPVDSPSMFGPLNGVRTALVIMAAVAGMAAAFLGQWVVTTMLFLGVAMHGLGWWYLWRHRQPDRS